MNFDTSSLAPYSAGTAAPPAATGQSGLDLSSLVPMDSGPPAPNGSAPAVPQGAPNDGQSTLGGVASQILPGLDQAVYNLMGAPVDLVRGAYNTADSLAGNPLPQVPSGTLGSSDWWANFYNRNVGTPIPSTIPANGEAERATRAAVEGGAMALVPESAFGAAGELLGAGTQAGKAVGEAMGAPTTGLGAARNAAAGLGAGAGSQLASDAVPDQYKPLAGLAGGLAGGLAVDVPIGLSAGMGKAAGNFAAPLTKGGREAAAGETLANAATASPEDLISTINREPGEIVPGSSPTTFQQTGDIGLGGLERAYAAQNPEMFNAARAGQNAARLDAIGNFASDGHPEAVANMVRGLGDGIDQQTLALYEQQAKLAAEQASVPNMGGGVSPEAIGSAIQTAVNPQVEAQQAAARAGLDQIGGLTGAATRGQQAQNAIQEGIDALTSQKNELYALVDPDKTMQMASGPLEQARLSVYGGMGPAKLSTISPAEQRIQQIIQGYGPVIPFQEGRDLSSVISSAMQEARSPLAPNYAAYGRLSQLRGAVEDAISDSVEGKVAQEQQAVQSGAMSPEDTMAAKAQGWIDNWRARKALASSGDSQGAVAGSGGGTPAVAGVYGATGESDFGPSVSSGTSGFPQDAGSGPFVDQQTADRLKTANQANKNLRTVEGAKPVASILQRPGSSYAYTMSPEDVAGHLWQAGPKSAASIKAILKAAQNSPDAIEAIRESAASDLRSQAPDGILTPQKFNQWRARHADSLAALEAAAPGTIARFENAATASQGLNRFSGYDRGASPSALPERYFGTGEKGFQTVNDLRELVGKDKADKLLSDYAADSLRKAAGNADGTIDPAKLATWRKTHSGALRALPEADAKFQSAGKAAEDLAAVAAQRKAAVDAFQKSELGKLLKADNPDDVTRIIGSVFGRNNSVAAMKQIAEAAKRDPAALQGLRKAIVDHMMGKLVSNTEAATSGRNLIKSDQFQTFIANNAGALHQVFTRDEVNSMRAVAQDLKRANRSIASVRIPGGSNTAQDLLAAGKHSVAPTLLNRIMTLASEGGASAIGSIFGPVGAVGGYVGAHVLGSMRQAGIKKIDDLVRDALLDPQLAKALLAKAPKRLNAGSERTLAQSLGRLALRSGAIAGTADQP